MAFNGIKNNNLHSDCIDYALCIFVIIFVIVGFLPVYIADYVPQDQWRNFTYGTNFSGLEQFFLCKNKMMNFFVLTGRPLVFLPECVEHGLVNQVADIKFLRIPSLLILIITIAIFANIFRELTKNYWQACVLAIPLVFSPGYVFMFYQGYTAAGVMAAVGLSLGSVYCLLYCYGREFSIKIKLLYFLTGILLFFLALLNYAAFAFIALPVTFFICSFSERFLSAERLLVLFRTYGLYAITCLIYLLVIKFSARFVPNLNLGEYEVGYANLAMIFNKIRIYYDKVFLGGTFINMSTSVLFLPFFVILSSLFIPCIKKSNVVLGTLLPSIIYIILFPIVCLISSAPVIISYFNGLPTRHVFPGSFMLGFCVLFCLIKIANLSAHRKKMVYIFNALLLLVVVVFSVQQLKISINLVQDSSIEIYTIRQASQKLINKEKLAKGMHLHVFRPQKVSSFVGSIWFSSGEYAPAMTQNPSHIKEMFTMVLKEQLKNDDFLSLIKIRDCRLDLDCGVRDPEEFELVITQSNAKNAGIHEMHRTKNFEVNSVF